MAGTGAQKAKEAVDVASPYVRSATDAVAPYAKTAADTIRDVAGPAFRNAQPSLQVPPRGLSCSVPTDHAGEWAPVSPSHKSRSS